MLKFQTNEKTYSEVMRAKNVSIRNLENNSWRIVLQPGWRPETSWRRALGCVVPWPQCCRWGLKAALPTAKGDIKTAFANGPEVFQRSIMNVGIYNVSLIPAVWHQCENVYFTSVISPSLHKECRASIRSASKLFVSFCKSLKYETMCCG